MCQAIEILLKAILLRLDFDQHYLKLQDYGHKLPGLAARVSKAVGRKPVRPALLAELEAVGKLFASSRFRYASDFDIFVDPSTVPSKRITMAFLSLERFVDQRGLFSLPLTATET